MSADFEFEFEDTLLFLDSNGDVYHKELGEGEVFYVRGECVVCFDIRVSAQLCSYGQSGRGLGEYRCDEEFIEFTGPGHVWYGDGRQDLLSASWKVRSLLFCDNLGYANVQGSGGVH